MILAVLGTGTGVGKTHVAAALLRHWCACGERAAGWKPMESGVTGERGADEATLASAAPSAGPTWRAAAALAPNLAARAEGRSLPSARELDDRLAAAASAWPLVVLELAGGACSPFCDDLDNLDWLARWPPALRARQKLALVAPDRLGVLHDVSATVRAVRASGLELAAIALVAAEAPDESTAHNRAELGRRRLTAHLPTLAIGRAPVEALADGAAIAELARALR